MMKLNVSFEAETLEDIDKIIAEVDEFSVMLRRIRNTKYTK